MCFHQLQIATLAKNEVQMRCFLKNILPYVGSLLYLQEIIANIYG